MLILNKEVWILFICSSMLFWSGGGACANSLTDSNKLLQEKLRLNLTREKSQSSDSLEWIVIIPNHDDPVSPESFRTAQSDESPNGAAMDCSNQNPSTSEEVISTVASEKDSMIPNIEQVISILREVMQNITLEKQMALMAQKATAEAQKLTARTQKGIAEAQKATTEAQKATTEAQKAATEIQLIALEAQKIAGTLIQESLVSAEEKETTKSIQIELRTVQNKMLELQGNLIKIQEEMQELREQAKLDREKSRLRGIRNQIQRQGHIGLSLPGRLSAELDTLIGAIDKFTNLQKEIDKRTVQSEKDWACDTFYLTSSSTK